MRAFFFFLQLAFLIFLGILVAQNPALVTIDWGDYRLNTSVGVLGVLLLAGVLLLVLLVRLWGLIATTPQRLAHLWQQRKQKKGYRALTRGLVAVAAGDGQEAQRQAERAVSGVEEQPLVLLLAAQAAQLNGDEKGVVFYYESMLDRPEMRFLGLRGLTIRAKRAGDLHRARTLVHEAFNLEPKSPWVLTHMFELNLRLRDFERAHLALRQMRRQGVLDRKAARGVEAIVCYLEAQGTPVEQRLDLLKRAHRLAPDHPLIATHLAQAYQDCDRVGKAQDVLLDTWKLAPHPQVVEQYFATLSREPSAQFMAAQRLASCNPDHPESHLLLAHTALNTQQWVLAAEHLERLKSLEPDLSVRACHLMARLYEEEKHNLRTARYWLHKAAQATDATWACGSCGTVQGTWTPFCGHCDAFDTLHWDRLSRPVGLPEPAMTDFSLAGDGGHAN